jgi:predicted RNase H-like HicB family nuclease
MVEEAKGYILLTGYAEDEDGLFASYCPELGTASCGDTLIEALDNLGEAIDVHLQGLADVGELEQTLRARQIRVESQPPDTNGVEVKVPPGRIIKTYLGTIPLVPNAV